MFRVTIRELLILSATAGLAVGWWLDHRRLSTVANEHRHELAVRGFMLDFKDNRKTWRNKDTPSYLRQLAESKASR